MADRAWFSSQRGHPMVDMEMSVVGNSDFDQAYHIHEVDANNAKVAGGEKNFTNWSKSGWVMTFSLTEGGTPISGASLRGTDGEIAVQDAANGDIVVLISPTKTGILQQALADAGVSVRGMVHGTLAGVDENGREQPLARARVDVRFSNA